MRYKEVLTYLDSFVNYEKKCSIEKRIFKLDRIEAFLNIIDNPQKNLKFIHIAGTKGKGSTSLFTAYILREAGFRVGLYTSPHLSSFRERIRILDPKIKSNNIFNGAISKKEICFLVDWLKPFIEKFNRSSKLGDLSFFEVYTTLAFLYFKKQNVDRVVLETGLGGRLDATNVIKEKIACITPISLEHTQVLGNTLIKIAREKLGIIRKKGITLNIAPQDKKVLSLARKQAKKFDLKLVELKESQIKLKASNINYQAFDFVSPKASYQNLIVELLGKHQLINAGLAILIAEQLNISKGAIYKGLKKTFWPARFEIVGQNPYIVIDGAQNTASFCALNNTLKQYFNDFKKILIIGLSSDKDIREISKNLDIYDEIILTQSQNPRAMPVNLMRRFIRQKTVLTTNVKDALKVAKNIADKQSIVVIAGSLFLAGQARQILTKQKCLID